MEEGRFARNENYRKFLLQSCPTEGSADPNGRHRPAKLSPLVRSRQEKWRFMRQRRYCLAKRDCVAERIANVSS